MSTPTVLEGLRVLAHANETEVQRYRALLEEVLDYFEDRADTRDTNDGPAPNEEMLWADRIRRELGK